MKRNLTERLIAMLAVLTLLCGTTTGATAEEVLNAILNARTTQAFKDEVVTEEDLETILQAGLSAASAINQQPWYFVALTNPEIMAEIADAGFGGMAAMTPTEGEILDGELPEDMEEAEAEVWSTPDEDMFEDAAESEEMPEGMPEGMPPATIGAKAGFGDSPAAIIIYMNEGTASPNTSFDCGLACQNMVIAANALGYGTKIVSSTASVLNGDNHDSFCEQLGVDPSMQAVAVILIGYEDYEVDGSSGASERNSLEEMVSFIN